MTQLELSQANLQREREASLSELQASLREKWAQERAVLQARQQFEVERLRAECEERIQREQQEYHRNMGEKDGRRVGPSHSDAPMHSSVKQMDLHLT